MCHNLNDEKKEHLKKQDNKRKKEKRDNLNANEEEQMKKEGNKRKKEKHVNFCDNGKNS